MKMRKLGETKKMLWVEFTELQFVRKSKRRLSSKTIKTRNVLEK